MVAFVGRAEPLARLTAAYQALSSPPGGTASGWPGVVLVTGEAGIGKTTLLTQFASRVRADAGTVVWGTCWDGDQAPAWWPWTQALRALIDRNHELVQAAPPELAAIVPELATNSPRVDADSATRVRVFDAAGQALSRAATSEPVVVILDDLHSADPSTVELLRFMAHEPQIGKVPVTNANKSWSSCAALHDPTALLGCWPTPPPNAPAKPSPPVSATLSVASPTPIQNSVPISTALSIPALPADTNQAHATSWLWSLQRAQVLRYVNGVPLQ